jgi:hypothetical protein
MKQAQVKYTFRPFVEKANSSVPVHSKLIKDVSDHHFIRKESLINLLITTADSCGITV